MHFGIVAVKADVAQFVAAFTSAWRRHEPASEASLAGLESLSSWMTAQQRDPANRGVDVLGFWQDDDWAVMLDPSYALASDPEALSALSARFGTALSFIIETTGGCAFFTAYEQGRRVRNLQSIDGELGSEGARLAQEAGLPEDRFYMDEIERLQLAFGITPVERLATDHPVRGAAFMDRAEYARQGRLEQAPACASVAAPARRPWWRVW